MEKRAVLVHGWADRTDRGWFKWLDEELTTRGWDVLALDLPQPKRPRRGPWVSAIAEALHEALREAVDENTFFVGHSAGVGAILRYVESLPENTRVGGVVFVAGAIRDPDAIKDVEDPERRARYEEWWGDPIDFKKLQKIMKRSLVILSDNDEWIPTEGAETFKEKLGSEIQIEHNKGHYSFIRDGITKIPAVLNFLLEN